MNSAEIAVLTQEFIESGKSINQIETGVSGLPTDKGKLTQKQVRDRSKRHFRKGQIDSCDGDKSK